MERFYLAALLAYCSRMLSSLMNSCSMLTLQLTYNNSTVRSLPAAVATAVAQRSQGGKQAKSIPLVKCTQMERQLRNACAAVQNSKIVHSACTAVELKTTRSNAQEEPDVNMADGLYV